MIWAAVLIVLLVGYVFFYNQLVKLEALVGEALNNLNLHLERRRDLTPLLVEIVKNGDNRIKLAAETAELHRQLVNISDFERQQSLENKLENTLRQLLAAAENESTLKNDARFWQLRQDLAAVETELQQACRDYNAAVRDYNVALHTVPSCWIAKTMKAVEKKFFETELRSHPDNAPLH